MSIKFDNLHRRLANLEERLQTLVEGSAARLLASDGIPRELPHQLVETIQAGLTQQADGSVLAPNLFTMFVHPRQAQMLAALQGQLDEILANLEITARQAGATFVAPPRLVMTEDLDLPLHQFRLVGQISLEKLADTSDTPAEDESPSASSVPAGAFLIIDGTQTVPLKKTVINLGRRPDNHIVIADSRVSRVHAQLRVISGHFVIFDLDSTGGTQLNGKAVHQAVLHPGDVIHLAGVPMVYGEEHLNLESTRKINLTGGT